MFHIDEVSKSDGCCAMWKGDNMNGIRTEVREINPFLADEDTSCGPKSLK